MSRIVAAVVISLVAGFALGAWVSGDGVESATDQSTGDIGEYSYRSASVDERLSSLEQVMAEEREARLILEDQLQALMAEIERLNAAGPRPNASGAVPAEASREARAREGRSERDFVSRMQNYQERRLSRFVDGGFSEDEARRVLQQESEAQFRAMQFAHEAQRNGEPLDPFASINGPQSILRNELGDTDYERYLEAQGQRTSIQITQVLEGSPGSRAGLQPGDQIVSYGGDRVFNVVELRNLTMQGNPGEDVIVEIDRDGVRMQLSLERGPVGISGSGANVRTMSWWGGG